MIQESLSLFKAGMKIDDGSTIGGELTTMPNDYNSSVWNIVYVICTNVVAPIGGMILVIILLYELLNMVMEGNNFREFDTAIFFKWIFKALCGIILISHTTDIIIGIFSLGNDITIGALEQVTNKDMLDLDVNTVADQIYNMLLDEHKADWGVLIVFLMFSFVMFLVMLVSLVIVMLVVISRLIEAFMYIAVAPIPMSTFMNKEWGTIGTNWLRNLMALAFQGLFIVVALGVFQAMFVSSVQDLIDNSKDTTKMYLSMVNCIVWAVALCFTIFKSSSISKSIFNAH
ncbi:MAG: conjugal transfer protein TrbL [Ruminococcus sp.]|nr:conjugal transfer protein TrbL [Ruminococcus sp.]